MRHLTLAAAAALTVSATAGLAQETLKMATIEPSLGQAITMATFANVVNGKLSDIQIEVAGGGAATLHQIEAARGNLDMYMVSPTIYNFMSTGKAMYANQPDAAEVSENLALLMWFPYGQ